MHNIEYYTYSENVNRDYVQKELDHHAAVEDWAEGCTGLGKNIRWMEKGGICSDYDSAQRFIEANDHGWYDQLAVRYYEADRGFENAKVKELKKKEADAWAAYREKDKPWAEGLKAEFVSCRNCGSKLKREYIHTNNCPLCRKDLRPESTLNTVKAALLKAKRAEALRNAYVCDHAKKRVKWLVKIEYHT